MATYFFQLKEKVIRLLADEIAEESWNDYSGVTQGTGFEAPLLKDAIHAALDAITIRFWKSATFDVDGLAEEVSGEDMPDDLLSVEGVYDKTSGYFLPKLSFIANKTSLIGIESNAWTNYPENTITFVNALGDDGALIYYAATWDKPEGEDDLITTPECAITALALYAASYCLLNQAAGSANLAQYRTKVDSGAPTDIPAKDMSDFFLRRFELELQRLPSLERGVLR